MIEQDPLELIAEYRRNRAGPRPPAAAENIHGLNEAIDEGEILVVVKPVKLNGHKYGQGDRLSPDVYNRFRTLSKLINQGYFSPQPQWEASRRFYADKKFDDNVLRPLETAGQKLEQELSRAKAAGAEARFAVRTADDQVSIIEGRIETNNEAIRQSLGEAELEA